MVAYNRIVLAGTLANGAEIWSTSCGFTDPVNGPATDVADLQAWADAVSAALASTLADTTLEDALSGNGAITEVRAYYYPDTGVPAAAVAVTGTNTPGSGAANQPLQSSAVLSLRTGVAGRRYRGRMYWPALAIAPSNFGTYTAATTGGLAEGAADLLAMIAGAAPPVGVFSPVVVSGAADQVTLVTSVAVGNVPDTQRRRRNGLIETYQEFPIP